MKILLITRGSQGDVLPYLAFASELKNRGHHITINIPSIFEHDAKVIGLEYILQENDDVGGMVQDAADSQKIMPYLKWVRGIINSQFEQLPALFAAHDVIVSTNTEFAVPSIAEYMNKPLIRTAYAPLLPGKTIPPPVLPFPKPGKVVTPGLLWRMFNAGTNLMMVKTLNKNRKMLGMKPIKSFTEHAASTSLNYLMYSRFLGDIDPDWKFTWQIGGCCFNDRFEYNKEDYEEILEFIEKDSRPIIFFTLGSCNAKRRDHFCEMLADLCNENDFRLIVGSGWAKTGSFLKNNERFFLLKNRVPHNLIFPHCSVAIHHGGSGTTHSVARAGIPQLIAPLIIDQFYWGYKINQLGLGPESISIAKISRNQLSDKLKSLVNDSVYKQNAIKLSGLMNEENGVINICDYIESVQN